MTNARGYYGDASRASSRREYVGYARGYDNSHRAEATRVVADLAPRMWPLVPFAYGYRIGPLGTKVEPFAAADRGSESPSQAMRWYQSAIPDAGYVALFDAHDLTKPLVEHYGTVTMTETRHLVSGGTMNDAYAGHWQDTTSGHWLLPLALGVPAGALGGYYYRKWQEQHPGHYVPWLSGEADGGEDVGAWPWYSIEDFGPPAFAQRGPWIDVIGAAPHSWPRTRALILSAVHEVMPQSSAAPAFVWSLESNGTTQVVPFESYMQALDYMRYRNQTDHVALAVFDTASKHWPSPVNWTKSTDPSHEWAIAQQIAKYARPQTAGEVVGAWPWYSIGEDW